LHKQLKIKMVCGHTAHNVPAVGDVFAARIRALRSKDQGCKNAGEGWRGNVQPEGLRAAK
jgi:hypothetical protein